MAGTSEVQQGALPPVIYPQLTQSSNAIWAIKMKVTREAQEVWKAVDLGSEAYKKGDTEYRKDRLALLTISQAIPENLMIAIAGKDSTKTAWDAIKTANVGHERVHEANLQSFTRNFESLKMEEGEPVGVFDARVSTIVNGIRSLEVDKQKHLAEADVVRRFLRAAPAKYLQLVTAIEQCVDLSTLTLNDLVGRYKAYDERLKDSFGLW